MTVPEQPLSDAVARTLDAIASATIDTPPEPVRVEVIRHEGALSVVSDGATVEIQLTDPVRLDAARLAEELSAMCNEALERARDEALAGTDGAPVDLRRLSDELTHGLDQQLRELDERIERLARS